MANFKLDWYQTESDVTVTVMKKGLSKEEVKVTYPSPNEALIVVSGAEEWSRLLRLLHPVASESSAIRVTPSKLELRLRKTSAERWSALERAETESEEDRSAHSYPTSSKAGAKNWDRIEKDAVKAEEEEKLEGDAAVNKLFQQIYRDASDETKKAMIKSYTESKGTCLSTDWGEVSKAKVECKPPDGMEHHKYEQ